MDNQGLHAYIISGVDPESRERLAYSLAEKALGGKNYNEPLPDKLAAARPSATKIEPAATPILAHPDLHEISPDGAEIKVAQAREVREMAQIRPNEAPRQVFIFHDADRMNINAQNALLATIEEPPTPCLFLFVCANERALLPTIRSRCAVLHAENTAAAHIASDRSHAPSSAPDQTHTPDTLGTVDQTSASRLAQALMSTLDSVDDARSKSQGDFSHAADAAPEICEAVLPLAKLKGDTAAELVDAARAACLRAAERAPAGSEAALRAIDGADFAAKCLDMLDANVSPAQVASYVVARAK